MDPWRPVDLVVSRDKTENLTSLMDSAIAELGATSFLPAFRAQAEKIRPSLPPGIHKMTIYGIGSLELKEVKDPRLQLALAIWMKKNFDWVGEVEFFDPVLSQTEVDYLTSLGFHSIGVDEQCQRIVGENEPTLFFLPYIPHGLYDNLLGANKSREILPNLLIIGTVLETFKNGKDSDTTEELDEDDEDEYEEDDEDEDVHTDSNMDSHDDVLAFDEASATNIVELLPLAHEYPLKTFSDAEHYAFSGLSWQFFRFP